MAQAHHLKPGKASNYLVILLELMNPVECGSGKFQNPFARTELNVRLLRNECLMMDRVRQGCVLHQTWVFFCHGFGLC